ncbi:F-box/FBD/LRR-repeat protein At1g16930-like [Carex rostrata]
MNKTRASRLHTKNRVSSINRNNVEVDRIGNLPDEVLTYILSFLGTKEAVQTCILSKRWKNTWASVPVLDIKQKDFLVSGDHDCSGDRNEALRMPTARFERFMTGFLDNRAPTNLDRVCCVRTRSEVDASIGWLDRVALLKPLMIDIVIFSSNLIDMPDLVFSCSNLQHLSMTVYTGINNTIIRPVSINLPSLKFLELAWVKLHDDFAQKLFMGCPSLERLKLRYCDLYFSGICSEVLKELTLHGCSIFEQMQISCPALISLDMMITLKGVGISLKNMSSVVNVVIKLYGYFSDDVRF